MSSSPVSDESPMPVRPAWVDETEIAGLCKYVFRASDNDDVIEPRAPYDERPTTRVPVSTAADVAEAFALARAASQTWRMRPFSERAKVLLKFHDLLVERQDDVIDLIQWETGKNRFSAWQEILQVALLARHYARRGEHYLRPQSVRGAVPGLTVVREIRVPKGVIGIISPWNYPLYLGVGDALPALFAGNGLVSKADSQTPLTLLWARALMDEAGLPDDLWKVVVGPGSVVGEALIDRADYICFTGSTATGRRVGQRAGERLIGCSLELGGKNPAIVRADADLDKAVEGIVAAAFANSGQMCISIERVLVHRDVYDEFAAKISERVKNMTIGQTYDYSVEVGTLTSGDQLKAVLRHVQDAVEQGATVLAGGFALPDVGPLAFHPTVLADVTPEMAVYAEETFGPLISLYAVDDDEHAIAMANEGSYGLSASIWTSDVAAARTMAPRIRSGAININDGAAAAAGSIEAPMGGMGESGTGRRHGAEGIRKYTEAQTVAEQRLLPLGPFPGMSIEKFIAVTNGQLRLFRRLGIR